jgi:Lantibiotic biosynthesis dehydratase C-term
VTATATTSYVPSAAADPQPGDWIALHIFYAGNPTPLLAQCVAPLVADLRERGLLFRYFFIRYWMEGPHLRLRLRPARPEHAAEVCRIAEEAVTDFLRRRPAVYSVDSDMTADLYRQMFVAEYGESVWEARYGAEGKMPVRENNTYAYIDYEPEHDRYGGPGGVDLAEWQFEKSSDLVLRLIETTNVHVRSVMFGIAAQLALIMAFTFLRDAQQVAEFFQGYGDFWEKSYMEQDERRHPTYAKAYDETAESLIARGAKIRAAIQGDDPGALTGFASDWADHCRDLRAGIADVVARQEMIFPDFEGRDWGRVEPGDGTPRRPTRDIGQTLRMLLSSYIHMTNNRLGVTIHDEVYLAYLLRRSVCDEAGVEIAAP